MYEPQHMTAERDNDKIHRVLKNLKTAGWSIMCVVHPVELENALADRIDLLILNFPVPEAAGEAIRRIRETNDSLPVIVTGAFGDPVYISGLLNAGADDYLEKPVDIIELKARIKMVLWRCKRYNTPVYSNGEITLDFNAQLVTFKGREVKLSRTEYRLLEQLARNPGALLSYECLLNSVWGEGYIEKQYLHVYFGHLRKKLESDPKKPRNIINMPGRGYRLNKD